MLPSVTDSLSAYCSFVDIELEDLFFESKQLIMNGNQKNYKILYNDVHLGRFRPILITTPNYDPAEIQDFGDSIEENESNMSGSQVITIQEIRNGSEGNNNQEHYVCRNYLNANDGNFSQNRTLNISVEPKQQIAAAFYFDIENPYTDYSR